MFGTTTESLINEIVPDVGIGLYTTPSGLLHVDVDNVTIESNAQDKLQVKPSSIGPAQVNLTQNYEYTGRLSCTLAPATANNLVRLVDLNTAIANVVAGTAQSFVAGAGLSFTSNTLNALVSNVGIEINGSNQISLRDNGITSDKLGTGIFQFRNTTNSTSKSSGSVQLLGGLGVQGSIHANDFNHTETGSQYQIRSHNFSHATGLAIDRTVADSSSCRLNLCSSTQPAGYSSTFCVYALGANSFANQERLALSASITGAELDWITSGSGVRRPLRIYQNTVFNTDNTVSINTTLTATSISAGALTVSGNSTLNTVTASSFVGPVSTASQPNITSLGTLTSLTVSGAITGSTASFSGNVSTSAPTASTHVATKEYVDSVALGATLNPSQVLSLTNTTASTSTSTGALLVSGGVGVGGALSVGGLFRCESDIVSRGGSLQVTNTTSSLSNIGTISVNSQQGVNGRTYWIHSADTGNANRINTRFFHGVGVFDGTQSTVLTHTYVDGRFDTHVPTRILDTTQATSTTTGALIVSGGIACSNIQSSGTEIAMRASSTRLKMVSSSSEVWIGNQSGDSAGDWHVYDISSNRTMISYFRGANNVRLGNTSASVTVNSTVASTSTSTGAVVVTGGVGIGGRANINSLQLNDGSVTSQLRHWVINAGTSNTEFKTISHSIGKTMPNMDYRVFISIEASGGGAFAHAIRNKSTTGFDIVIHRTDGNTLGGSFGGGPTGWGSDIWVSIMILQP